MMWRHFIKSTNISDKFTWHLMENMDEGATDVNGIK